MNTDWLPFLHHWSSIWSHKILLGYQKYGFFSQWDIKKQWTFELLPHGNKYSWISLWKIDGYFCMVDLVHSLLQQLVIFTSTPEPFIASPSGTSPRLPSSGSPSPPTPTPTPPTPTSVSCRFKSWRLVRRSKPCNNSRPSAVYVIFGNKFQTFNRFIHSLIIFTNDCLFDTFFDWFYTYFFAFLIFLHNKIFQ